MHKRAENLLKMGYDPELDTCPELDPDAVSYYQTILHIQRWIVELGRFDIITKVSLFSTHVALLREVHLEAAIHIMALVGQRYNFRLVHDPSYSE